jgi:hypothetical protein
MRRSSTSWAGLTILVQSAQKPITKKGRRVALED